MTENKKDSLGLFMGILLSYLVFCLLLPQMIAGIVPSSSAAGQNAVYLSACAVTGLLFVSGVYKKYGEKMEFSANVTWMGVVRALVVGAFLFLFINFLVTPVLSMIFQVSNANYNESVRLMFETPVLTFLQVVLLAPFLEEMIFRGFLLKRSLRARSVTASVLLVAGFFGLLHMSLMQGLAAMAAGIILCLFYVRQRSVALCVLSHVFYNFLAYLMVIRG